MLWRLTAYIRLRAGNKADCKYPPGGMICCILKNLNDGLELFKTLGSDVRMRIVELLSERGEMNMNEIASALELTNGALTAHIRRLEECGIIHTVTECTGHGNQKRCSMKVDQILVNGRTEEVREIRVKDEELQIGYFDAFDVTAPCGLCSVYSMIGRGK